MNERPGRDESFLEPETAEETAPDDQTGEGAEEPDLGGKPDVPPGSGLRPTTPG